MQWGKSTSDILIWWSNLHCALSAMKGISSWTTHTCAPFLHLFDVKVKFPLEHLSSRTIHMCPIFTCYLWVLWKGISSWTTHTCAPFLHLFDLIWNIYFSILKVSQMHFRTKHVKVKFPQEHLSSRTIHIFTCYLWFFLEIVIFLF